MSGATLGWFLFGLVGGWIVGVAMAHWALRRAGHKHRQELLARMAALHKFLDEHELVFTFNKEYPEAEKPQQSEMPSGKITKH